MIKNIPESMKRSFERTSHPYYFYEALMSIPEGLTKVLEPAAYESIKESAKAIHNKKVVYFTGNGTSYYNGIDAVHMMNLHTSIKSFAYPAFEFVSYPPNNLDKDSVLVVISHSGNTPEPLNALKLAKSKGATIIVITDYEDAKMVPLADHTIISENDQYQLPKNKSYVAALLRVNLLALEVSKLEGKNTEKLILEYFDTPKMAKQILSENEESIKAYAESLAAKELKRAVICGSGFQYCTALEGSLKFTEAALVYSQAWEFEEFLHGPMYSMKLNELLVVNAIAGNTYERSRLLIEGIRPISSNIWAITNTSDDFDDADFVTRLPEGLSESIYSIYSILVTYIFIYYFAVALGNHLDHGPYDNQLFMDSRWILRRLKK